MMPWMWITARAFAVDWYLESGATAERGEPARIEEVAVDAGFDARVVRRFVDGEGWRYLARIEGFADAKSAAAAAGELAAAVGAPLAVFQLDGQQVVMLSEAPGRPGGGVEADAEIDVEPVLDAMVRAHGTGRPTLAALDAGPVWLEYRRVLDDGRVVQHRWGRSAAGSYVEIAPGPGASGIRASRTRIVGGRAWLSVDGGPWIEQDAAKAAEVVAALGPEELMPLVLGIAAGVEDRPEFARMTVSESRGRVVLAFGGDATTGAIALELDRDRRVGRIALDGDAVVREMADYRPIAGIPGAQVPWRITTRRSGGTDRVEIERFAVGEPLPDGWFAVGG